MVRDVTELLTHAGLGLYFSRVVCVSGVCPTRLDYRALMVERSGLAETLVMSLALMEEQLPVKLRLLQTLQILSRTSGEHLQVRRLAPICLRL